MAHFSHLSHYMLESEEDGSVLLGGGEELGNCPLISNSSNYVCQGSGKEITLSNLPTYLSLVSCTLSCLGSLLIFISYFSLKGIRNVAQKIITALAVADLFTALGYIIAGWNILANGSTEDRCSRFSEVCEVQSFITSWSSLSSFGWSCALALHFYLLLTLKTKAKLATLFYWENFLFWLLPLVVLVPMLVTNKLGYSHLAVANWCFIKNSNSSSNSSTSRGLEISLVFIGGKFWEILSYVFVLVAYTLTRRKLSKHLKVEVPEEQKPILPWSNTRDEPQQSPAQEAQSEVRQRLHIIPLAFVLLRMWGTLQMFYSLIRVDRHGCTRSNGDFIVLRILGIVQAIGDGGQGWSNALIYIFMSPTIRKQLFIFPLVRLLIYISNRRTKANNKRGAPEGVATAAAAQPLPRRPCADRDHTHGNQASMVQSADYARIMDGKDSGVDAEMSSLTNN